MSRRQALVIGNNYPGEGSALPSCVNDARAVSAALRECGWEVIVVTDANLETMTDSLYAFRDNLTHGDDAVFYFSGHGQTFDGALFCIPCEMGSYHREKDIVRKGFNLQDVTEALVDGAGGGFKLMLIDACRVHRGAQVTVTGAAKGMSSASKGARFAAVMQNPDSADSVTLFATGDATVAAAGSVLSRWTKELVDLIPTPGLELDRLQKTLVRRLKSTKTIPSRTGNAESDFWFRAGGAVASEGGGGGGASSARAMARSALPAPARRAEPLAPTSGPVLASPADKAAYWEKMKKMKDWTAVIVPYGVTEIPDFAFQNCRELTSVVLPVTVRKIGEYAFNCCTSLTTFVIPDSVTTIGSYAFWKCSLTAIVIPESVTTIGLYAFRDCTSLTTASIPSGATLEKSSSGNGPFWNSPNVTVTTRG